MVVRAGDATAVVVGFFAEVDVTVVVVAVVTDGAVVTCPRDPVDSAFVLDVRVTGADVTFVDDGSPTPPDVGAIGGRTDARSAYVPSLKRRFASPIATSPFSNGGGGGGGGGPTGAVVVTSGSHGRVGTITTGTKLSMLDGYPAIARRASNLVIILYSSPAPQRQLALVSQRAMRPRNCSSSLVR
jgi:hypothetical protein